MSGRVQSPWVWQRHAGYRSRWIGARQALVVADHIAERDPVAAHQPGGEPERGGELARVAEDLPVARADVLDPDRRPVETDRVAAPDGQAHQLVDGAVPVDDEVRARAGPLVQLGVGRVGCERVPGGREALVRGVVLDDHARVLQLPRRLAVVPRVVRGGLAQARGAERHGLPDDRRLLQRQRRQDEQRDHRTGVTAPGFPGRAPPRRSARARRERGRTRWLPPGSAPRAPARRRGSA